MIGVEPTACQQAILLRIVFLEYYSAQIPVDRILENSIVVSDGWLSWRAFSIASYSCWLVPVSRAQLIVRDRNGVCGETTYLSYLPTE